MILQHAMFPAEMSLAETAITNDALRAFFAGVVGAFLFLLFGCCGGCAAAKGEEHVEG
jgi:hypothetical protein